MNEGKLEWTTGKRYVQRLSFIGRKLTAIMEGISVVWKTARFCGHAFVLIALGYGLYGWMDENGWISHNEETVISARSDWLVGESKECLSYARKRDWATFQDKEVGYAMSWVNCDDGPEHKMRVTFYGREVQTEYEVVSWRCVRNEVSFFNNNSFTCYQAGGER